MVLSRHVLLVLLLPTLVALAAASSSPSQPPSAYAEPARMPAVEGSYHITYPERIHYDGTHITHNVRQTYELGDDDAAAAAGPWGRRRGRGRRGLPRRDRTAHYRLQLTPEDEVVLDVRPNRRLLAPGLVVERRPAAGRLGRLQRLRRHCLMQGRLRGRPDSMVAISSCQGLAGYIHAEGLQYIVEPVRAAGVPEGSPRPHLVYRRHAPRAGLSGAAQSGSSACQTEAPRASRRHWSATERAWSRARRAESRTRRRRSVSAERNVETLIVADPDVVQFYAEDNLEAYLLTVMNGVAQLYHDASIGNAINVILVRIMILESPEDTEQYFTLNGDGDSALKSFCTWQSTMNPSNESHPNHHDVAVLLTRRSICTGNQTCNTLGLAEVSGMCQPSRSCNINQDTGLSVSYTIAHELGHNFGMNHDGPGNGCDQQSGLRKHVMSPNLVNDVTPVVWSRCSRREITKFLDRDWGHCLDDQPTDPEYSYPQEPPGMLYNADHQCKLLYGPAASHCQMGNLCETLWCSVEGRCLTKLEPAAEGTSCAGPETADADTWCSAGQCVEMQSRPRAVDGGWGGWGDWGDCSRSCGTGVQSSTRHCDRPVPANGGKYCVGERRRYRTCSTEACPEEGASFRAQQCSAFDTVPYQGHNYTWTPVYVQALPCQLTCQPVGRHFTAALSDAVVDGTPCQLDSDICINGKCRRIGCDGVLGSEARADRCGVCHGNGSLCHTVRDSFSVLQPKDGYAVVATLPVGARSIRMEELAGTGQGSFLSVTRVGTSNGTDSENSVNVDTDAEAEPVVDSGLDARDSAGELNANRLIQWSGEYWVGGSALYYSREEHNETLIIPGPLKAPLVLKVLLQNSVTHVRYEYTVPGHEGAEGAQVFSWRYQPWEECTEVCGGGKQTSQAVCVEDEAGRVEDIYCTTEKPEHRTRPCNQHDCPASWYAGEWQACQAECGRTGNRSRLVRCVREHSDGSGKNIVTALSSEECDPSERPASNETCQKAANDCLWHTGPWKLQKCTGNNHCERKTRHVWCPVKNGCKATPRPAGSRVCNAHRCRRRGRHSHKRRRPHSAARDSPPLTLLERARDSAGKTVVAHRGREASRMIARLMRVKEPLVTAPPTNHTWSLGEWGECNSLCGEGRKSRTVQCIDLSRRASVELSRCPHPIPDMYAVCTQPCLEWRVDPWSPCSVPCGPGRVTRQVTCPEPSRCDLSQRPADSQACWEGSCAHWRLGAWQPCSRLCGGGFSRRSAVCASLSTGLPMTGCGVRPVTRRACNLRPCPGARYGTEP